MTYFQPGIDVGAAPEQWERLSAERVVAIPRSKGDEPPSNSPYWRYGRVVLEDSHGRAWMVYAGDDPSAVDGTAIDTIEATQDSAPNQRWAMDFMHDVLATGATVRVFTLIDVWRRECLALRVGSRFTGSDIAAILADLHRERGTLPLVIQCDNGTEFTSTALDHWAYWNQVQLDFSRPGKPVDNSICEAFNGSLRRECLSQHWFASLEEAAAVLKAWQLDYNNHRPHTSLGLEPPARYGGAGIYQPRGSEGRSYTR